MNTYDKITIDPEFAVLIPPLSKEERDQLEANLLEHGGARDALVVWNIEDRLILIDGHNRFEICMRLGLLFDIQEIEFDDRNHAKEWIIRNQFGRRNLSAYVRTQLALQLEETIAARAKQRQLRKPADFVVQNSAQQNKTRDEVAKLANVSHDTVAKVKRINAQGAPELVDVLKAGGASILAAADVASLPVEEQREIVAKGEAEILRAAKEIRAKKAQANAEARAAIKAQAIVLPEGKYQCLIIDPPWPIEKIERDERPNQVGLDYPTMTIDELMALPVQDLAADDCHLYLWTTHKFLPDALRLAEAWGFRYQCLMTWVKNVGFTPFSWMYSTEHILFCRRGSLPLDRMGLRLDFQAKVREHSRKPNEFYDLVSQASPGPRLDMFSREQREGFEQWGLETQHFEEAEQ